MRACLRYIELYFLVVVFFFWLLTDNDSFFEIFGGSLVSFGMKKLLFFV